jgi:hypothetical protein
MAVTGGAPSPTVGIATGGVTDAHIASVAAGKITGSLPVAQVTGAATLGANTFAGTQTISGGNLALPATTGATAGVLTLGGQSFLHGYGSPTNTFVGGQAGGGFATTGWDNAAGGYQSLYSNTTGPNNAAFGAYSLTANTTGGLNAAFGYASLYSNTTGPNNAAFGAYSLNANTIGGHNAAGGYQSLYSNTTGPNNAAFGYQSMRANTTGDTNAAVGYASLEGNTTGYYNVAVGGHSLAVNTTGANNIAIGSHAGLSLTTGSFNIDIGHAGVAGDGNTIRIGTTGTHSHTFIAGISGATTLGSAVGVVVDANGKLGTIISSRRFKDDIADMDAASSAVMTLRPVTFHYKTDQNPSGRTLQYGLIAEEVAEVYPGLVARSADGQIETVLYQFLPPMLLNEYQKLQHTIEAQAARFEATASALKAENEALRARIEVGDEQIRTLTSRVLELDALQKELVAALARLEKRQ